MAPPDRLGSFSSKAALSAFQANPARPELSRDDKRAVTQAGSIGGARVALLVAVCGKANIVREIRGGDSLLNPTLIVEVLPPSTEDYDRGNKFEDDYRFIPSLREYVLVAQDRQQIEVRSRDETGHWTTRSYQQGQEVLFESIAAGVDLEAVYRQAKKNAAA